MKQEIFESIDKVKKSVIEIKDGDNCYSIDFIIDGEIKKTIPYARKNLMYVRDAAENFVTDVFKIEDLMRF